MAKTTKITLVNAEIISITNYMASEDYWQNHNDSVSGTLSWIIRKNRKALAKAIELIREAEQELNEAYNTDEKSELRVDEDGNTTEERVVKKEFEEEYIKEKMELYNQTQELDIEIVNADQFMPYNLKDIDWELMSFMINEDDEDGESEATPDAPVEE